VIGLRRLRQGVARRVRRLSHAVGERLDRVGPKRVGERTFRSAAGQRIQYGISAPDAVDPAAGLPLVVCLHPGWHGDLAPRGFGRRHLCEFFEPAFRDLHAILVAPDCPGARWTDPQSERAALELVDVVREQYGVASHRVVAAGLSDGATAAWHLLARHPERFCAAIAVAGSPQLDWMHGWRGGPVYAIHSRADAVMPLAATRAAVGMLRIRGVQAELVVVEDADHHDTSRFSEPLRTAASWLRAAWENEPGRLSG
jgi:predicted peptidase